MGTSTHIWASIALAITAVGCGSKDAEAPAPASETPSAAAAETQTKQSENDLFTAMTDRHAASVLRQDPIAATQLGVSEAMAGDGFLSRLPDYSSLAREDTMALNDRLLGDLRSIDATALTGTTARSYEILRNTYETAARRNQFSFGRGAVMGSTSPYIVHQLAGPHLSVPRLLLNQHPVTSASDAQAYVARLEAFATALYETEDALRLDAEAGVVPPAFGLNGAVNSIRGLMEAPPADQILVSSFASRLSDIDDLTPDERDQLVGRARTVMAESIYPAFESLADTLTSLVPAAGPDAGVWRLDEGAAFYQHALNRYGANGRTADDIHEIGLAEVARISDEMNDIFDRLGMAKADTAGERFALLAESPDQLYPNTDEAKEILLGDLRQQVDAINELAPDWFATLPTQPVEVRRIPVYEQDTAPGGYYTRPSLDGTRPGIYWINLKDTADWPKYTLKTLTYHEAVPGHHFQISLQQAIEDMPLIRNMSGYSEFSEGWALYSELVAAEMGMYADDPLGDLGRLQSELFRAARLVVDTGLHAKRWTREDAIDWMVKATGETRASVTREVERYSVWPGQATSYKLGMLMISDLRERAEEALGDQFDIKAFHDEILLEGAMPLPVLEAKIDAWIATQTAP